MRQAIRMLLRDLESSFESMLPWQRDLYANKVCLCILTPQIKQMVEMYIKAVYAVGACVTIKLS